MGDHIGKKCYESLKGHLDNYICNHHSKHICSDLTEMFEGNNSVDSRLRTYHDDLGYRGMLGAAIKGMYQYFEDQKIHDLQEMKRKDNNIIETLKYANREEIERAIAAFSAS